LRNNHRSIAVWAIALGSIFLLVSLRDVGQGPAEQVDFNRMVSTIRALDGQQDEAAELRIVGMKWTLSLDEGASVLEATGPVTESFVDSVLPAHSAMKVEISAAETNTFWQMMFTWLPTIVLLGFFFFMLRNLQGGSGKAMSFGKSRAKMLTDSENDITFDDVAGCDEAKNELEEIVEFLRDPKKFTRLGGKLPKGVLLMGSPGTGKTLLARAVAGEAGVPFFTISGSDFVEMFVGVGASRVRDLFEQAKRNAPCIIFVDEIDAVGRHRGAGMGGGHDEREQTLNQLLVEMDGFESNQGIIMVAATNRPDVLDPALLRPGRFDRRVVVPLPDINGRSAILKVHSKEVPLSPDVEMSVVARSTPGFSGADLANLVNEAALLAAVEGGARVEPSHLERSRDKVTMGSARKSMAISKDQAHATAVHEAGHAVLAFYQEAADPLHKVTIIPHGQALGLTMQLPEEDRYSMSRKESTAQIVILLGGYLAERLYFGEEGTTTGVSNDLKRAKQLAQRMVREFGMSKLGPIFFGSGSDDVFLGREMAMGRPSDHSDATAREVDEEVRAIIERALAFAENLLAEHRRELDLLAAGLVAHETLDGAQIRTLFETGEVPTVVATPVELQSPPAEGEATVGKTDAGDDEVGGMLPTPA
jgi:cell division protease FtsH